METQIRQYLEYLEIERGYSTGTIEGYRGYLARFLKWMLDTHPEIRDFAQLNLDHVRGYRMFLARLRAPSGDLLKKVTQAYYVISLRALLRYLIIQRQSLVLSPELIELPKSGIVLCIISPSTKSSFYSKRLTPHPEPGYGIGQ